jgi:hypothetical protein
MLLNIYRNQIIVIKFYRVVSAGFKFSEFETDLEVASRMSFSCNKITEINTV